MASRHHSSVLRTSVVLLAIFGLCFDRCTAQVRVGGPPGPPRPEAAKQSAIRLRNGCTLIVNSTSTDQTPEDAKAISDLQLTLGQNGTGLAERAQYASAYVNNQTLELQGGRNVLQSAALIEANNTRILVNVSRVPLNYTSLDLQLFENNTLEFDGATVNLDSSTLRFNNNNWFTSNGSTLSMINSILNFTSFFTWFADRSTVLANTSSIELDNALTWWESSTVKVDNSTFNITGANATAPAGFDVIAPVLYINNSGVNVSTTAWYVEGLPLVHVGASNFVLYNTTLTFKDTVVHFSQDEIDLTMSSIVCDNSTIVLYSNAATKKEVVAVQDPNTLTNVTAGDALVGQPLGKVDITLTAPQGTDIDVSIAA